MNKMALVSQTKNRSFNKGENNNNNKVTEKKKSNE